MNAPMPLIQIQRWMQAVIMHPEGVVAGIESDAAQQQLTVAPERLEQVICRSKNLTSLERLQVYAGAYYARLLECLRNEFPSLVHVLGTETFDRFAFAFLQRHPSKSYTLANLGREFPQFLADTKPTDARVEDSQTDWPDFLIDLALVERTYGEVFDGPGVEDTHCLQAEDVRRIPAEQWPESRIVVAPCLRLLSLRFPVHEYISAVRHRTEARIPPHSPTYLVVSRRDYVVRRKSVSQVEFAILQSLADGASLSDSLDQAARLMPTEVESLPAKLEQWFFEWTVSGYIQSIKPTDSDFATYDSGWR